MKKALLLLSLFILTALACDVSVTIPVSNSPAPPATLAFTEISPIPATSIPSATFTAPQPSFEGVGVAVDPLSIILSPAVASGARGIQVPRAEGDVAGPSGVTPGHIQMKLEGYALQNRFHEPQIYVYPAQAYAEMSPAAFESMHRLNNILGNNGAPVSPEQLPTVPFFNAQQVFASNISPLSFQNGKGVRFLTEYAQYFAPVNNQDMFYQFQGLTNDGAYYVIAILPVRHPALAETSESGAVLPSGGIPYPNVSDASANWPGYYAAVTSLLDTSPQDVFTPTLDQLDLLIQSMRVSQ